MVSGLAARTVVLRTGVRASVVVAPPGVSGDAARSALKLPRPRGLVVLNGGTEEFPLAVAARLRRMLQDGVARVVIDERLTVVTGGTDAGVFALFGLGLDGRATAPCVGVAPAGVVERPAEMTAGRTTGAESRVPLEPHHTHFLLVEGDQWGDETEAMLALVAALAVDVPSLVVLAGGGAVAKREILAHVRHGREVVVLAGSGRLADEVADVATGRVTGENAETIEIAAGRLTILDVAQPPSALADLVRSRLSPPRRRGSWSLLPLFGPLPTLRWKPGAAQPFVSPETLSRCPALQPDAELLERELLPWFRTLDEESLRAQNTFRLGQLSLILGGTAASALGAAQAAFGGGVASLAVLEAVIAGLLTAAVVYVRGRNSQREYFTKRLKAERLRAEYFRFLGQVGEYAEADDHERLGLLRRRIRDLELHEEET